MISNHNHSNPRHEWILRILRKVRKELRVKV